MTLKSLNTTAIATRTLYLYRAYLEEGLPEYRARVAAIGKLLMEADDLKVRGEIDFCPPNRTAFEDREYGHGGFAPGRARWEQALDSE